MSSFVFSLNSTVPVFLVMVVGYVLNKIGILDEHFCKVSDRLVFKVALPALLFSDMVEADISNNMDGTFVLFCAGATLLTVGIIWICARIFIKDKADIAEFVQCSYRSSAAILGCAFIMNIYGTTGMAPVMIIGSVPLYNIFAVLILTLENPAKKEGSVGAQLKRAAVNIVKNPIILGIFFGTLASLVHLPIPQIVDKTLSNLGNLCTPLALLSIGATFKGRRALGKIKLSMVASVLKLVIIPAVFLPVAVVLGFRDQEMVALIVMLGSVTTPTSYVMAKNMGHEGTLSASIVAITTVLSAITLTFWIFLMRSMGYVAGV